MAKSPDAFRTISEVAEWLDVPTHVLRFWESRFAQVKPVKRAGGRRYYRPSDMELLGGIKRLLHDDGMTIRGVQKMLREKGVKHVSALAPATDGPGTGTRETIEGHANVVPLSRKSSSDEVPDRWPFVDDADEAVDKLASEIEASADAREHTGSRNEDATEIALSDTEAEDISSADGDPSDLVPVDAPVSDAPTVIALPDEVDEQPELVDLGDDARQDPGPVATPSDVPDLLPAAVEPAPSSEADLRTDEIRLDVPPPPIAIALLSALGRRGRARHMDAYTPALDRARSLARAMERMD